MDWFNSNDFFYGDRDVYYDATNTKEDDNNEDNFVDVSEVNKIIVSCNALEEEHHDVVYTRSNHISEHLKSSDKDFGYETESKGEFKVNLSLLHAD